jgi:hypothetical protein
MMQRERTYRSSIVSLEPLCPQARGGRMYAHVNHTQTNINTV